MDFSSYMFNLILQSAILRDKSRLSLSSEEFDGLILLFGGVWNARKKKN